MIGFNARRKKRTAIGFFWLALTGFLATTGGGGGRKRSSSSPSFPAKTTLTAKLSGFLQAPVPPHITEAVSEAVETITHETLGKSTLTPMAHCRFSMPTSQRTSWFLFLPCFPAQAIQKTSSPSKPDYPESNEAFLPRRQSGFQQLSPTRRQ